MSKKATEQFQAPEDTSAGYDSLSASSKGGYEPAPSGSHRAICYQVIALGVQDHPTYGPAQKIMLGFELSDELMESTGKPFVISRRFTLSLSEKGALRPFLEAWRGRPFAGDELKRFTLSKLLGAPALITVMHREKNGKVLADITGASPLPKSMPVPTQVNPSVLYATEMGENEAFDGLPEWLQNTIRDRVGGPGNHKKTPVAADAVTGADTDL